MWSFHHHYYSLNVSDDYECHLFLQVMADRIIGMRTALRENIEKLGSPLPWEHITNQVYLKIVRFRSKVMLSDLQLIRSICWIWYFVYRLVCSVIVGWHLNKLIVWQTNFISTWLEMVASGNVSYHQFSFT